VIFLAGLTVVLTGATGAMADTGRMAPHWHAVVALLAVAMGVLEYLWIPPLMRRNHQLIVELKSRY
jgi:hypothetical protein